MHEQENTKIVQQLYEDFKNGDIQAVLSSFAEDIQWHIPEMENVPHAGKRAGREQVGQFFSELAESQDVVKFEPQDFRFVAQDDRVVVLGYYAWRVKATGRELSSDWAHVWTVKDSKIISFHEYIDTAAASKAYTAAQTA